ncbi:MAG: hypothetical protein ABWZ80_11360 [Beijerinckiaceae bacterium]
MTRFSILSAAAGAAACLLARKGLAFFRDHVDEPPRIAAPGALPAFGRAIARARQGYVPADPDITGAVPAKKTDKPEDGANQADRSANATMAQATQPAAQSPTISFDAPRSSTTERAVLERLGERREEIEGRAREMDTREALLRAAEKKLDSRVGDLKTMEDRLTQASENREQSQAAALKSLVTMYETMKPKEAVRVFDRLDLKVLIPVVQRMNPRKMAEVLAAMSPEAAEKLTVALATRQEQTTELLGGSELPRLDAPPRAAPSPAPPPPPAPAQPPRN